MLKVSNVEVTGFPAAIRGMRNPMNSWDKSDSLTYDDIFVLGDNDLKLMRQLAAGGPVHAKYRRFIDVTMDILAPLYWWKEFDTYRVGVAPNPTDIEMNSCSTMHKIHSKEFELEDFSYEHLSTDESCCYSQIAEELLSPVDTLGIICEVLNDYRQLYLASKGKTYWWQMIQLLPTSYNQLRTVHLNYEVVAHIIHDRENHKLDEWHVLCDKLKQLPYADGVIFNIH